MSGQQSKCSGFLVFQQAASSNYLDFPLYEARCYGITSSVPTGGVVDLAKHDETRSQAVEHSNVEVYSLNCVGSAIYQHGPTSPGGETPPPFCLGVEYVRYTQALMHHRAAAAAHHPAPTAHQPAHAMQNSSSSSSIAGPAPGDTVLYPTASNNSSSATDSQFPAYAREQSIPSTSDRSHQMPAGPINEELEPELSVLERMQRTHQLVSERLEGKDPLWFAKAFAHRASLNWASMKHMAGEVATAIKADLGLQESDDTE